MNHSPFAAFLEEKKEGVSIQELEQAKNRLLQAIKMQQEKLEEINWALTQARKNQPEKP